MACKRNGGFTLLEVLVAFTLLAVTLVAVLGIFRDGLRTASDAENHAVAAMLARSQLAALDREIPLLPGTTTGVFDNGFLWAIQVDPAPLPGIDDPDMMPVAVTVEVSWGGEKSDARSVTLSSMRLAAIDTLENAAGRQ